MKKSVQTFFAPELIIPNGIKDIDFYKKAFGAIELRRFSNDDGSIHVSEMTIDGALFHLHEVMPKPGLFDPARHSGTTAIIGLMVEDAKTMMQKAIEAGAKEVSPMQDYDYGYRQGQVIDPHGHRWMIEQVL